jgi:hypothetical protein
MNCLYYINEYIYKCENEGIEPEEKYRNQQQELKRINEIEDAQSRKATHLSNEHTLNSQINRKIAKTWVMNKMIYQGGGTEINQSQIVNHIFNDESILEEYENNKQKYLTDSRDNSVHIQETQRRTTSNFHKRKQTRNKSESH